MPSSTQGKVSKHRTANQGIKHRLQPAHINNYPQQTAALLVVCYGAAAITLLIHHAIALKSLLGT
jgi:hypothetical protein